MRGLAAGQRFVEVVGAGAGQGGDDAGGGAGAGAGLDQVAQGVDGEADVFVVLVGGGRADHQDDLALDVAAEAPRQLAERAARDLLVHLRQLAADGGGAVGGERGQRRQRLADPARGLEGDDGLGRAQHPLHLAGAARQEALEAPAVGRQPGGDQRHRHHRGAGQDGDLEVAFDAAADQLVAGVGDRRHAGVGDEGDDVAALDPLRQLGRPRRFVALVVGDQPRRRADAELVEQASRCGGCPRRR